MKKILVTLPLVLLMLICNQFAYADLYQDGVAAYRNSNYELAEYYFREAVKIFPDNARYHYYLAITLVQQGKIYEAEGEYKKVQELAPGSQAARKANKGLALVNEAQGKFVNDNNVENEAKTNGTAMSSVFTPTLKKVTIPITKSNNAIIVPNVLINNKLGVNFILDTGATYTSISRATAATLGIDLNNAKTISLKTANGIIRVPRITLSSININGIEARNVEVTVHNLPAAKNITGLLGLSFLDQFTITIDKRRDRIILEGI